MTRVIKLILVALFIASVSAMTAERKFKIMEANLRSGRIMGGRAADVGQFPFQVSLQTPTGFHFCGGSILNKRWVLTAAHCTYGETSSSFIMALGSNILSAITPYGVEKYTEHPEYNDDTLINDVSVVRASRDINLDTYAKPIQLLNREVLSGTLHASGWGRTSPSGSSPNELRFIETNPVPLDECARILPGITNPDTFCTFNAENTGVCFGDSGGPLVLPGQGLVGVASFVIGTCGAGYPDGFASVFYHRNWILIAISG